MSFSRGSALTRDQNCISALAGGFFTSEPPRKTHDRNSIQKRCVSICSQKYVGRGEYYRNITDSSIKILGSFLDFIKFVVLDIF